MVDFVEYYQFAINAEEYTLIRDASGDGFDAFGQVVTLILIQHFQCYCVGLVSL